MMMAKIGSILKIHDGPVNYDPKKEVFLNSYALEKDRTFSFTNSLKMLSVLKNSSPIRSPKSPLPTIKPNLDAFKSPQDKDSVPFLWLGHSSFLIRIQNQNILIDPVFGPASPVSFAVKRFQPAPIDISELPPIDIVVFSHNHYDHLDARFFKKFSANQTIFLAPLKVGALLAQLGVSKESIYELDWWEQIEINDLTYTLTPAQHFSGRGITDRFKTLWGSWCIRSDRHHFFYSGDSGYGPHFKEIGKKLGPFDFTFIENGQYNQLWKFVHQLPEEAVQSHLDLKGKTLMPVHWGAFSLAPHAWNEPIIRIAQEAKNRQVPLITPKIGQVFDLTKPPVFEPWWMSQNEN